MCDSAWKIFISLKLTFVLLLIIIIGAIIGMGFDQTIPFNQQISNSTIFWALELNDAFHSWWFSFAVLLLSLNLIACSIERLPKLYFDFKNPRPYLTNRRLLGLSLKHEKTFDDLTKANNSIKKFLKLSHVKALSSIDNHEFFYHEKHKYGRFGVYIVHIALLIIMYSSIYANHNGINGNVLIDENKKTRFITAKSPYGLEYSYDLGFYIGCSDFRLKTFIDNSALEYESDLYITTLDGKKETAQTVRVNQPLSFAGFTFYQASFRPIGSENLIDILIKDSNGVNKAVKLPINQELDVGKDKKIKITSFYEDFAGLGQAIKVEELTKEKPLSYFHIFRRYPEFDGVVRNADYSITFLDVDREYATGLSVGFVPGISIIFCGFFLFLCGLFMCFFLTPTRYFVRKTILDNNNIQVVYAASGFRHINQVKEDFYNRCTKIDRQE